MKGALDDIMAAAARASRAIGAATGDDMPTCATGECDGTGWAYEDDGAAYRCPSCDARARRDALHDQLVGAGIGRLYLDTSWTDLHLLAPLDALARVDVSAVVRSGHHAILSGPPGSGKTQAAVLLARGAIEAGHTARVANLGSLSMAVRAGYGRDDGETEHDIVQRLARVDLLVLDDVGAGESGAGQVEGRLLYQVTEARQNARRPTVVTTNLDPRQLAAAVGSRVMNRLTPVKLYEFTHGRNFRDQHAKETPWL